MGFPRVMLCEGLKEELKKTLVIAFYQTAIELIHESNDVTHRINLIYVLYAVYETQPLKEKVPITMSYFSLDEIIGTAKQVQTKSLFDPQIIIQKLEPIFVKTFSPPKLLINGKTDPLEQLAKSKLMNVIPSSTVHLLEIIQPDHQIFEQLVDTFITPNKQDPSLDRTKTFINDCQNELDKLPGMHDLYKPIQTVYTNCEVSDINTDNGVNDVIIGPYANDMNDNVILDNENNPDENNNNDVNNNRDDEYNM